MKILIILTLIALSVIVGLFSCKEVTQVEPNMNIITEPVVLYTAIDNYNSQNIDYNIRMVTTEGLNDKIYIEHAFLYSSPQKGKMAYIEYNDSESTRKVIVSNLNKTGYQVLAEGKNILNCYLSPDATKVLYVIENKLSQTDFLMEIHVFNLDEMDDIVVDKIHSNISDVILHNAVISPDSKKIAVYQTLTESTEREIYVMNIDGSNKQKVFDEKKGIIWLTYPGIWNSDGDGLLGGVTLNPQQGKSIANLDIYNMLVSIIYTDNYYKVSQILSPDGKKLAYFQFLNPSTPAEEINLCLINTNGHSEKKITKATTGNVLLNYYNPTWSLDNNFIIYYSNSEVETSVPFGNQLNIYDVNADVSRFIVSRNHIYNGYVVSGNDLE